MRIRLRQLRMVSYLAAAFIAMRLVYSIVFGGANAPGTSMFALPEIPLVGPFRHITLFGTVTVEGLLQNVSTALPFALLILGFGFLASLISPSQLLALSRKVVFGQHLIIAIAIGWAQLPALIEAISRIRFAMRLRGEKNSRMLIPVLETAVTRALAIAQRISIENSKPTSTPSIEVTELRVGNVLVPKLIIEPGQIAVITGPTASGKTNLLLALSGLSPELGIVTQGSVIASGSVGYLPQQPRDSIWGPTVQDEIPFSSESSFRSMMDLEVQHLSEGEAVRLVIERELRRKPQILLLDEPFASLDEPAAISLIRALGDYLTEGGMAIVVEHRTEFLDQLQPRWYQVADGSLKPGRYQLAASSSLRLQSLVGSDLILEKNLQVVRAGKRVLIKDVQISAKQAQAISISGPNGSGKTSLLKAILDESAPSEVAFVPEIVTDFFVTQTLSQELERADRIAGVGSGLTRSTFESICGESQTSFDTHPRDLSHGTQLALAIAMQLSHKPKILLVDEPVKGFDPATKQRVSETLKCVLETGTAIIFATHDRQFANDLAHQHYAIENQHLELLSEVTA